VKGEMRRVEVRIEGQKRRSLKEREKRIRYLTAYAQYLEVELERVKKHLALKMQKREAVLDELSKLRSGG
jgi:hypothetical protein